MGTHDSPCEEEIEPILQLDLGRVEMQTREIRRRQERWRERVPRKTTGSGRRLGVQCGNLAQWRVPGTYEGGPRRTNSKRGYET